MVGNGSGGIVCALLVSDLCIIDTENEAEKASSNPGRSCCTSLCAKAFEKDVNSSLTRQLGVKHAVYSWFVTSLEEEDF